MKAQQNVLIITASIPYPLNAGGNVSQFAVLEALQKLMNITLCCTVRTEADGVNLQNLSLALPLIDYQTINLYDAPSTTKPSLLRSVFNAIQKFRSRKNNQTKTVYEDEFDQPWRIIPVYSKSYIFCERLISIINSKKFNLIQIEFFEYLDLVHIIPPHIPTLFVHHEIRYQRLITSSIESKKSELYKNYIIQSIKSVELAFLKKFDAVITFSEIDKKLLQQNIDNEIYSIPFPVLNNEFLAEKKIDKIDKIIFLGAEGHYPNSQGVIWFIENCFELIWTKCKIPFYVVGNWEQETIAKYTVPNKIIFTGFVNDLQQLSNNAINVAPIYIGSGIRTKILYAMAAKTPVITTSIGVEGIEVTEGKNALIANDALAFINAVEKLVVNIDYANEVANAAYDFVYKNYNQQHIAQQRIAVYNKLISGKQHQNVN